MSDPLLNNYTEGLSVLYVEDDPVSATIIEKILERSFQQIYGAHDGAEGLWMYHLHQPDLIVTDLMMPMMDGIAMLREIRKNNQKIPVLLMTASLEHVHLVEAINLGVAKFLAKPIRPDALQRALLAVTREIYLERVADKAHRHEVELLQYRNRYHSLQQERAQSKEHHIARNHLENLFLQGDRNDGGWLVDLLQVPRDIMSGDSYSIIPTRNNTLLLFLADAMGHGLSASVTSMVTTAFFNHVASDCVCQHLGFPHLVSSTLQFAARNLLEEEVFSCLVMELDPVQQKARFACCGMPALLLVRNGQVERLRGANPPVSAFSPPLQLQELSLEGISDILLATDGLSDVTMRTGGSYRERLPDDLLDTATAAELFSCYGRYCSDEDNDDDITLIRLTAFGAGHGAHQYQYVCPATLRGISNLQKQAKEQMEAAGSAGEQLDNLDLALTEALLNALEHGCLGMGKDKQRLMLEGEYDDLLMAAVAQPGVEISMTLTMIRRRGRLQVWVEIIDPGPGFDPGQQLTRKAAASATSGRGFMIMKRSVDLVRRNSAGNRVVLMHMFEGEQQE
jgi:CheY-like chemotaxis protein/anti-sigma regulatory factor (Ser/Thr protein kinase)